MTQLPIPIPDGYKIIVSVDQKITTGDILAQGSSSSSQDAILDLATDLEVDSKNISKFLTKKLGERIEEGEIIAKKGGMLSSREVKSKVAGTIAKIDEESGQVSIRGEESAGEEGAISSPVDGTVAVCDNNQVVLNTDREAILGEEGSGEDSVGEVLHAEEEIDAHELSSDIASKIVISRKLERDSVSKAIGLGAAGVVGVEIEEGIFENLQSKNINTPVIRISDENYKKIKKGGRLMLSGRNKLIVKL